MFDRIKAQRERRKKYSFRHYIAENLRPTWYFDKMAYVWVLTGDRFIRATPDQIGNWVVYDGLRMVSGYMKTKEEAQKFAVHYIADEIIAKYYKHLNGD